MICYDMIVIMIPRYLGTAFHEVDTFLRNKGSLQVFGVCQSDLCQGPKKIRDPGFAESKVWDLDGSWTLHVLFVVGLGKPRTSKL